MASPISRGHSSNLKLQSEKGVGVGANEKSFSTVTSPGLISPVRNARPAQPRVLARLQALFPASSSSSHSFSVPTNSPSTTAPPLLQSTPSPKFVKARIITWNMHDSLPKGDLEELLGFVPLYGPRSFINEEDRMRLPDLSATEEDHPYHIVVIAGQECPTLSGIPLGLAANFKHKEAKDRDKEKDKHKEREIVEKDREKDKDKDKDLLHQTKSILSKHLKHDYHDHPKSPDSSHGDLGLETSSSHHSVPTSGWSAVLEDWFANGIGALHDVKPVVTGTAGTDLRATKASTSAEQSPQASSEYQLPNTVDVNWKSYHPTAGSHPSPVSNLQAKTGPYELLVKERLMGIYMAVYVHRDIRSLVQGFSTGAVLAGLMGGRLGNKGGCAVSVNIHGTTLLFINAHLAAHEGKVPLRVANLAKIKAELPVESYLSPDDPRTFAEDLTDRFDHTWIFGDLNFRLDISRLHADWLISRKEYAKAFEFDQLHKLMESGEPTFSGFHEANIDFPPTFKYDVLRTLKRDRHKSRKGSTSIRLGDLHGVEERGSEAREASHEREEDDEGEAISLRSSGWTSNHSKYRTDVTEDGDDSDSPASSAVQFIGGLDRIPSSKLVTQAALKAKATWLALINSSRESNSTPLPPRERRRMSAARLGIPGSSIELSRATPNTSAISLSPPVLRRAVSTKIPLRQREQEDDPWFSDTDKGVYDSSSKKRVPSWCDRILWKTTVEPPQEPEPEPEPHVDQETTPVSSRGRANRVSQLLQAFRPRPRRDSSHPDSPVGGLATPAPPGNVSMKSALPFSRFANGSSEASLATSPGLYQSKSLEPLPSISVGRASLSVSGHQRSASPIVATGSSVSRRQSMPASSRSSRPVSSPRRAETDYPPFILSRNPSASPISSAIPPSRGAPKRWFLNLISRDHAPSTPPSSPPATSSIPSPPQHRKGDVVCLSYRTLDDRQMRRLEGRSDHRPVIGSYAIYV